MQRLTHIVIAFVLLLGGSAVAHAQSQVTQFPALWQAYLTICGNAIADPANAEARLATLSPLPKKLFVKSSAGNIVSLEQFDERTFANAYLYVVRLSQGYWMECDVGSEYRGTEDAALIAPEVHAMLSASGQMIATLGEMQRLPQSNVSAAEFHETPWFDIIVEGAFPGRQITTIVEVTPSGSSIRMAGHLP